MAILADARPTKQFFIENLTRDLSLEDAILDLVDNAMDAFIRTRDIDVSPAILSQPPIPTPSTRTPLVVVRVTKEEFSIVDRCGGMDLDHAQHHVFRFGRSPGSYPGSLGVYGIGMKRALFKLGKEIVIESRTETGGFRVSIDVARWSADDSSWEFPLERIDGASSSVDAGTSIVVRDLTFETILRIDDGTLLRRLADLLASTYTVFLERGVTLQVNGTPIAPRPLPIASSNRLTPTVKRHELDGVTVELVAGLAARVDGEWVAERAGWYVLCNGRVVVSADRTELTGWGVSGPQFVSKYRGFVGVAFFFSKTPSLLPWTTTKRGLNLDSRIYHVARKDMATMARPVLSFLDSMYPSDPGEGVEARTLVEELTPLPTKVLLEVPPQTFDARVSKARSEGRDVWVQFQTSRADVAKVKKQIGKPRMSAGNVGLHTFKHYLKVECSE